MKMVGGCTSIGVISLLLLMMVMWLADAGTIPAVNMTAFFLSVSTKSEIGYGVCARGGVEGDEINTFV